MKKSPPPEYASALKELLGKVDFEKKLLHLLGKAGIGVSKTINTPKPSYQSWVTEDLAEPKKYKAALAQILETFINDLRAPPTALRILAKHNIAVEEYTKEDCFRLV